MKLFENFYYGKKVFITGHTGFKGSWLSYWLHQLGADVCGYSLAPPSSPSHYQLLKLPFNSIEGDIRDLEHLQKSLEAFNPEIVFHLAAQPLVRLSYSDPLTTYSTNLIGSLNLYEALKNIKNSSLRSIVSITTDKVYENREWTWGYRENDRLGGHDPYSSSKACMEIMSKSFRDSYWPHSLYQKNHQILMARARAGNVIGGGDWALDRLIPDTVKATHQNQSVVIRNPNSTRPWQHVLEPLAAYLLLGKSLFEGKLEYADAWNFGPRTQDNLSVGEVMKLLPQYWSKIQVEYEKKSESTSLLKEMNLLYLDSSKAKHFLNWDSIWGVEKALEKTILWYKHYYETGKVSTEENIEAFIQDASIRNLSWVLK